MVSLDIFWHFQTFTVIFEPRKNHLYWLLIGSSLSPTFFQIANIFSTSHTSTPKCIFVSIWASIFTYSTTQLQQPPPLTTRPPASITSLSNFLCDYRDTPVSFVPLKFCINMNIQYYILLSITFLLFSKYITHKRHAGLSPIDNLKTELNQYNIGLSIQSVVSWSMDIVAI